MSQLTEFFLLLGALYLMECVLLVPRGGVAFVPRWWSGWRIVPGSSFYGNPRWGLLLGNPSPGLSGAVLGELWPVSLGPSGVYAYVAQTFNPGQRHEQPARFWRFADVRTVEWAERRVLINGETLVQTVSPLAARQLAALIKALAQTPVDQRIARIDAALRASLDTASAKARWETVERAALASSTWSSLLFGVLFMVAPAAAWYYGLELTWPMLLAAAALLLLFTWPSYWLAHRRSYPDGQADRITHLAMMIPLPPAAIRAPAFLIRNALCTFHPLAIARVLCTPAQFEEFARAMVCDLVHPIAPVCPTGEPGPAETEQSFRARLVAAVDQFLTAEGFSMTRLAGAPQRDGDDHVSYCPRCHCQFIVPTGECEACNQKLLPFGMATVATPA